MRPERDPDGRVLPFAGAQSFQMSWNYGINEPGGACVCVCVCLCQGGSWGVGGAERGLIVEAACHTGSAIWARVRRTIRSDLNQLWRICLFI